MKEYFSEGRFKKFSYLYEINREKKDIKGHIMSQLIQYKK
jgi:hypothetical protein